MNDYLLLLLLLLSYYYLLLNEVTACKGIDLLSSFSDSGGLSMVDSLIN